MAFTIFVKRCILDVWQGSTYASEIIIVFSFEFLFQWQLAEGFYVISWFELFLKCANMSLGESVIRAAMIFRLMTLTRNSVKLGSKKVFKVWQIFWKHIYFSKFQNTWFLKTFYRSFFVERIHLVVASIRFYYPKLCTRFCWN